MIGLLIEVMRLIFFVCEINRMKPVPCFFFHPVLVSVHKELFLIRTVTSLTSTIYFSIQFTHFHVCFMHVRSVFLLLTVLLSGQSDYK